MGEISGTIYMESGSGNKVQGRILVNIYDSKGLLAAQTLSETNGSFLYLGLKPGAYTIQPDPDQMRKLNLTFFPGLLHFEIIASYAGDVHRGVDFILRQNMP
jgi:hypothetical protein